ncbi:P-loop containing nucleoside triphosphate hydrolase protein [Xylariomycetidae sp. FL0641]|nr:P-loop containing nucleoside triphosphate hydrolase protein [Xylariomycetidae sp. FL0641]
MSRKDKLKQVRDARNCTFREASHLLQLYEGEEDDVKKAIAHAETSTSQADRKGNRVTPNGSDAPRSKTLNNADQDLALPWKDQLPRVDSIGLVDPFSHFPDEISLENVVGAIQQGASVQAIREHLMYYHALDADLLEECINGDVQGFPAIFYVAETGNIDMLRSWILYGGDPNASATPRRIHLLAFAIIRGGRTQLQATRVVDTLLRLGASPDAIPKDLFEPYQHDIARRGPKVVEEAVQGTGRNNMPPCDEGVRRALISTINLTQRYLLHQASRTTPPSGREKKSMKRKGLEELFALHLSVIGQCIAVESLRDRLLAEMYRPSKRPLVFLFAGPSGHGKTELARQLGDITSLDTISIACPDYHTEMAFFGPKPPYVGSELGSPLNNFLARKSGERSVVFLDEFEKTSSEIHETLLIPFDEGRYKDRRDGGDVDCAKTIWILATNKLDPSIHRFCEANKELLENSDDIHKKTELVNGLRKSLKKECMGSFGRPLTGRISAIVPFLTFSPGEQAVISHKGLMRLESELASPVVETATGRDDLPVGNMKMTVHDHVSICSKIAEEGYEAQIGARSIFNAIDETVRVPLVLGYMKAGDEYHEGQGETPCTVHLDADGDIEVRVKPTEGS